jgi:transposase
MALRCKRCGGEEHVKNGFMEGLQRYRRKACGLNFADTPPRGMPLRIKVTAVLLHLSGLSMNRTAKLLGVSTPSVMTWIEQFAEAYAQKPEPEGRAVVVELDEMWRFLKKAEQAPGLEGSGSCYRTGHRLGAGGSWSGRSRTTSRARGALGRPTLLHRRPGGLRRADPAGPAPRRQGGDARHRARPFPPAALARALPPPHPRGLRGQAHGRRVDRAVRPLRRCRRDRRTLIYAGLRPCLVYVVHAQRRSYDPGQRGIHRDGLSL